jgi:uncharacterized protein (DUF362 family)
MGWFATRREFLAQFGAVAAGVALPGRLWGQAGGPSARVVIARDEALERGSPDEHAETLRKLLDAAVQRLSGTEDPAAAWRKWFRPNERVGIKVNALGLHTLPAVVEAIISGLCRAGVPAENIIVWDRFDSELEKAGFRLNRSGSGPRCRGTDAERYGNGYAEKVETSGKVGTCFSRILVDEVDALICVPVLKDHNLAGVSLSMKCFYGAIHNPNKYHDNNCDPYIVDVVSHPLIARKWRLTVVDAVRGQYQGGPGKRREYQWSFGGLLVGTDFVAVDAVGAELIESKRREAGLKSLEADGRPPRYIATAASRGLGVADLDRIERIEI